MLLLYPSTITEFDQVQKKQRMKQHQKAPKLTHTMWIKDPTQNCTANLHPAVTYGLTAKGGQINLGCARCRGIYIWLSDNLEEKIWSGT